MQALCFKFIMNMIKNEQINHREPEIRRERRKIILVLAPLGMLRGEIRIT
jgi:hypothetical protein